MLLKKFRLDSLRLHISDVEEHAFFSLHTARMKEPIFDRPSDLGQVDNYRLCEHAMHP